MSYREILKSLASNLGLIINKRNLYTSEWVRLKKLFDYHEISLMLDVGANEGQYSQLLREEGFAGRILSFEPLSTPYKILCSKCSKDSLWDAPLKTAIGDFDGDIEINISKNSVSSSTLSILESHTCAAPQSEYISSELVKIHKLDSILPTYIQNTNEKIFLKIDVQGAELQVLKGAQKWLPLISGVQLEMSLVSLYDGQALYDELMEFMVKQGFYLVAIFPGFSDIHTGHLLQFDGVFFR